MALDANRITAAAMITLKGVGMKPDDVPFLDTGKSALEHIVDAVAQAVISEIKAHAEVNTNVNTTVAAGIGVQVTPATGTGATVAPGAGTGSGVGTVS